MSRNFMELLQARWDAGFFSCVGLDSDSDRIPDRYTQETFNKVIVDTTKDLVCAYKVNSAFYEAQGPSGEQVLIDTIHYIHSAAPDIPVILDFKRGDIGNTNAGYVKKAFDVCDADAITVHPYLRPHI